MAFFLEVEGSTIRMVATNGHRMAIAETDSEQALEGDFKKAILPKKSLQEMQRLLSESDEPLSLSFQSDSHVSFKLDKNSISFTSNLIEGEYPAYNAVIPVNNSSTLRINKKDFAQAVANAVIIQKSPPRTVEVRLDSDKVKVSSSNFEGEVSEMILDATFDGESMDMSFNEEYIQTALKTHVEEELSINIGSSDSSILILEETHGVRRKSIIMPLNG